jgi:2-polyprenyl-3-methyl-5-hydroxy-6-metoxy-1,4-benzoquinol methylase
MKSNQELKQWGKVDPLFAVASWKNRGKDGSNPWTEDEFYALGKSDWEDFLAQWRQYGCDPKHCIEIGCGAGRLTRCIAETFDQVTALDVSEEQINYARSRINHPNVSFCVTDGVEFPSLAEAAQPFSRLMSFSALTHCPTSNASFFRPIGPCRTAAQS